MVYQPADLRAEVLQRTEYWALEGLLQDTLGDPTHLVRDQPLLV